MYEHDLKLCRVILEEAKSCGISAVIASDMAVVTMANELDIEVHLSTQLSISNSESIKFYAPLCDRIVLAREVTLKMIKTIYDKIVSEDIRGRSGNLMEIEAFAHGALCIAVAGRCGMSLYNSNASANRGACEQNCRKEYKVTDVETGDEMIVDNSMVMSPNDILTIDFIDEMLLSGVRVFKIEGRGRAPEYVGAVTSAYRKAIDAVQDGSYCEELVTQLREEVEKVYNRGFSTGYYLGQKQGWSGAYGNKATRKKMRVGKVVNVFTKSDVLQINATEVDIAVGDEYVIVGNTTGAVNGIVGELRIERDGEMLPVEIAPRGNVVTLVHEGEVRRGDQLYKMEKVVELAQ
jgi:putative protease